MIHRPRMGPFRQAQVFVATAGLVAACVVRGFAAEPALEAEDLPRLPALEPREALRAFVARPGVTVELAASEPEVVDPVALSFDEDGRAYVVEMRDYSERRPERLGRVRLLEDRDADGRFETSRVFLDGLPWPTAVVCWDGGVFIGATPDLLYAKDQDGDGRADIREVVFTGFASQFAPFATNQLNVQAMLNALQWAPDCRIHGSGSLSGGQVRRVDSPFTRAWRERCGFREPGSLDAVDLRGGDFSFDPRSLELRRESGGGQHGMSFDAAGRKFLCSNSDHLQWVRFGDRPLTRAAGGDLPNPRVSIAVDGPAAEVFRISPEEPWRVIRTRWRVTGLVQGLIEGGGRSSGYFTSATGLEIYRGDALGPEFAGDAFVADCGSNLIHRKKLRDDGGMLLGERPADEARTEFLASRDTWFRPVQLANGPDGCLWILDMYREIIEHPWSLPPGLKRVLDLNAGNDRGRLYRVRPERGEVRRSVRLGGATSGEWVALLGHANGWHRQTASRLLVERPEASALPRLRETLRNGNELARFHALQVLAVLPGGLSDDALAGACSDAAAPVRVAAIRLAADRFGRGVLPGAIAEAWDAAVVMDPFTRLELALALGEVEHPRKAALLARLIRSAREKESLLVQVAAVASQGAALEVLRALADAESSPDALRLLARRVVATGDAAGCRSVWQIVGRLPSAPCALAVAAGLAGSGGAGLATMPPEGDAVRNRLGGLASRFLAGDLEAAPATRLDAVALVAAGNAESGREQLIEAMCRAGAPGDWAGVGVEAVLRSSPEAGWSRLVERWSGLPVVARAALVEAALRRASTTGLLLEALENGRVRAGELTAGQVQALRSHADAALRGRAQTLLGAGAATRAEAIAAALPSLDLAGVAERGRTVFEQQCATCHRLGGAGHAVGPDLESVRSQPPEKLLVAIVDPNREVQPSYFATTVETADGESVAGMLVRDDEAGVVLQQAGGLTVEIPRGRVVRMQAGGQSLMPEGFEGTLKPQELADLIALILGR